MMRMKLSLILLISGGALISVDSARQKSIQLRFVNVTAKFNPEISTCVDAFVTPGSNGSSFDLIWNLSVDVPKNLHFDISSMMKDPTSNTYKPVFKYDFDYCRIWDGFMSQGIARIWFNRIKRFGNFPVKCPIRKGQYYVKKFKINKGSLPPFSMAGNFLTKVEMFISGDTVRESIYDLFMETETWMG